MARMYKTSDKRIKLTEGSKDTLKGKMLKDIMKKLSSVLDKSKTFKKAEISTLGEAWGSQIWKNSRSVPLTTMHIARFLKK